MIKIIFINIDGDFSTIRFIIKRGTAFKKRGEPIPYNLDCEFDPLALRNFKKIIESTDAYIVVASSWRIDEQSFIRWQNNDTSQEYTEHWEAIINNFRKIDLDKRIIGVTPSICDAEGTEVSRALEIKKWRKQHPQFEIESFVVLDVAGFDMEDLVTNHFVQSDKIRGITTKTKNNAIKILNRHRQKMDDKYIGEKKWKK